MPCRFIEIQNTTSVARHGGLKSENGHVCTEPFCGVVYDDSLDTLLKISVDLQEGSGSKLALNLFRQFRIFYEQKTRNCLYIYDISVDIRTITSF